MRNTVVPQSGVVLVAALAAVQVTAEVTYKDAVYIELPVNAPDATVTGVACEVRSKTPAALEPHFCWTYGGGGTERQSVWFNNSYAIWRLNTTSEWQPYRIEVPLKRGVAKLRLRLSVTGAAVSDVEVRNPQIVPGGFPQEPPYSGPPYLDWIEALAARPAWERHPAKPGPPVKDVPDALKPYKMLPLPTLIGLMPDHRPFGFADCGLTKPHEQPIALTLRWTPSEPGVLRRPDGTVYDPDKEFSFDKVEEVTAPSGKTLRYDYYDPPREQWETLTPDNIKGFWGFDRFVDPPLCRVYRDAFMTEVRSRELLRACDQLARHYVGTGDRDSAVRAAAILYSLARVIRDYPVHGVADGNKGARFLPPDSYDQWFAFIIGNWYTPSTPLLNRLLRDFSMIQDPTLWQELSAQVGEDSRARVVNDVFLYVVKTSLKYDAFQRCNPWTFFHNTIGGQIRTFIDVGKTIGCPDLVHYAVRKAEGAFRFTYMADGMFPESTSYLGDMTHGLSQALAAAQGYTDPAEFNTPVDGRRYRDLEPTRAIPLFGMAERWLEHTLRFPNGDPTTFHDTWPGGGGVGGLKDTNASYLIPDFGHLALGWGSDPTMIEAHLHYSGSYNHSHADMLTFTLWAYGDELAADLGYTHFGSYLVATPLHNLVVIDGQEQRDTARGDLLAASAVPGCVQVAHAAGAEAYAQAKLYRRLLVTVPFGPGRDAVVDVFEAKGGNRHEWTANGGADYGQTVETDLPVDRDPAHATTSLAADGKVMDGGAMLAVRHQEDYRRGAPSLFYGAFRVMPPTGVRTPGRWQVTLRPPAPVARGTAGASARATSTGPKPSLRLHWLGPDDATPILAWAPRHRYTNEASVWADKKRFIEFWNSSLMPKVFARREGRDLDSTFVAVWEPFMERPSLDTVERHAEVSEQQGVALTLRSGDERALVMYRKPETASELQVGPTCLNGRCAVFRQGGSTFSVDLCDAAAFENDQVAVTLTPPPELPVVSCVRRDGVSVLTLAGALGADAGAASVAGEAWLRMAQGGQASWWLPVASVGAATEGRTEVRLTRLAAFEYDGASGLLRETHYPFRVLTGKATARGQANLHLSVVRGDDGTLVVDAFASCPSRVLLKGVQGRLAARVSGPLAPAWQELPIDLTPAGLAFQFSPAMVARGRTRVVVGVAEGIDRELVALAAPGGALAPKSARARYLRIACPGPERSFAFAEAQIFNVHEENVARRGKASQSSTYVTSDGVALAAGLAIDGDTSGAWKEPLSLAATRKESDPWWELDLTGEHDIARVVLLNRTDAAADGIVPATVTLLDAQRHPVRTWEITSVRGKYVFRVE